MQDHRPNTTNERIDITDKVRAHNGDARRTRRQPNQLGVNPSWDQRAARLAKRKRARVSRKRNR